MGEELPTPSLSTTHRRLSDLLIYFSLDATFTGVAGGAKYSVT